MPHRVQRARAPALVLTTFQTSELYFAVHGGTVARQIGQEDAAREALAHSAEDIFGFVCVRACVHVCVRVCELLVLLCSRLSSGDVGCGCGWGGRA